LISDQIKEGQAVVEKSDRWNGHVTIRQGNAWFSGDYEESSNGVYLVACCGEQVCLVKNLKTVLWSRSIGVPSHEIISIRCRAAVSNNGNVLICASRYFREAKRVEEPPRYICGESTFTCVDQNARTLFEKEFDDDVT